MQEALRSVLLLQIKDSMVLGKSRKVSVPRLMSQAAAAILFIWPVMIEEHVADILLSPSCDFNRNELVRNIMQESLVEIGV